MPSLLDDTDLDDDTAAAGPAADRGGDAAAAERLRTETAAVRLSFTWPGVTKTLTPHQKTLAADPFGAEARSLSAGKKLLDTSHPAYREVTAVRGRAVAHWKEHSLPYPEAGVRLVRREAVADLDGRLRDYRTQLDAAVAELARHYPGLKAAARRRLGDLYDEADYAATPVGLFGLDWDYPAVEPPDYLRRLSPRLYEEECGRARARFAEAVRLAEEAFVAEFGRLVSHLCERLSGTEDGKPKVFRDSAVGNLAEFFGRFRSLNVGSNAELERLVGQATAAVRGVAPRDLRDSDAVRQRVASQLAGVQSVLDGLLVDRPRRNVLRPRPGREGT